jgi:hypothetical protein
MALDGGDPLDEVDTRSRGGSRAHTVHAAIEAALGRGEARFRNTNEHGGDRGAGAEKREGGEEEAGAEK